MFFLSNFLVSFDIFSFFPFFSNANPTLPPCDVCNRTTTTTTKVEEGAGDPEFIKRQDQKRSDLDEQLREYIGEWRKQRAKEEDDLKKLKEKQAKRKITRADEERKMAERKKAEEERRIREIEEKKQRDIEEKRQRLEEAEKKRQAMMQALKDQNKNKGPNFTITKRDAASNLSAAQLERNKTKEQLEEEKKISLSIRIKPLMLDGLSADKLRDKAHELWDCIVKLETEKYDLEERQKRQDYDLKELKERQKQQLRHKAQKKGLDPEALTGKYPPKIQVASKYERRVDTRSYSDKKHLFEGGFEDIIKEFNEKSWKEKYGQFDGRQKTKLPKWFGERPGKKAGEPESPEGEEEGKQAADDDEDLKEPIIEPEPEEEEEEEEVEVDEEEEDDEEEEEE